MRELSWWREFNRRFDPFRHLTPAETDQLYAARSRAPSRKIRHEVELAAVPEQVRLMLAGARGCGKSTELTRCLRQLGRDGSVVVPIYVDVAHALPDEATTLTWLPLLAAAVRRAAEDWNAPAAPHDLLLPALEGVGVTSEIFATMMSVVGAVGTWLGPTGQAAAAFASVAGETARQVAQLGRLARTSLSGLDLDRSDPAVEGLIEALRAELDRLTEAAGRPPLLLLDGFDKRPDVESVLEALRDADLLLDLPASIVLSAPAEAMFHARFASLTMPGRFKPVPLYNLPVVTRMGAPKAEGIDVLVRAFELRAEEGDPEAYRHLLPKALVRDAARLSSGVVREFLELLRRTGLEARDDDVERATPAHLERAVRERRHAYQATLDAESWRELAGVLRSGQRPRHDVDELLFTNVVACYENDDLWFRPNELLVSSLQAHVHAEE